MLQATMARGVSGISAVGRTVLALEALVDAQLGLTVAELAATLGVEKSIASRLLASLATVGYVRRDPFSDRYGLTLKLVALGFRRADVLRFPQICLPVMQPLADETGHLVQLCVVEQDELVFLAMAEGTHPVRVVSRLGRAVPLHATAGGKVWLASLPEERALSLALGDGLAPLTPRTITRVDQLLAELERVRRLGYATIEGEYAEGANGVAVPIGPRRFGIVVAALILTAPDFRLPAERMAAVAPRMMVAAGELEAVWPLDAQRLRDARVAALGAAAPTGGGT